GSSPAPGGGGAATARRGARSGRGVPLGLVLVVLDRRRLVGRTGGVSDGLRLGARRSLRGTSRSLRVRRSRGGRGGYGCGGRGGRAGLGGTAGPLDVGLFGVRHHGGLVVAAERAVAVLAV